jgi:predicted O-linked N-acetylglucosamine transferase (SPINDLY family)
LRRNRSGEGHVSKEAATRAFQRNRLKKEQKKAVDGLLAAAFDAYRGGRLTEAQFICGQILTFLPDHAEALGLLGSCMLDAGEVAQAEDTLRQAIAAGARSAEMLLNHGAALFRLRRFDEAREVFEAVVKLSPGSLLGLTNLASTLRRLGQHERALGCYKRALAVAPGDAELWHGLGGTHFARGEISEAERCFDKALALDPGSAAARVGLALVLVCLSRYGKARDLLDAALAADPNNYEALTHRAGVHLYLGDVAAALVDVEKAMSIAPRDFLPLVELNRAEIAMSMNDSARAASLAQDVLERYPNSGRALAILGSSRSAAGDIAGAVALFDRALAVAPDDHVAISKKIFALDFLPGASFVEHQAARRQWWEQLGVRYPRRELGAIDADPDRRLRVGYVSADFRDHSAGLAVLPVLQNHDKSRFETFAYSNTARPDQVTGRFRALFEHWTDVAQLSDDELADRIQADRIDILIDCSGHTAGHRLAVFARKPAPVQASGWGHASGTGIPLIDYVLSDPVAIPAEVRPLHAETVADLPCLISMPAPGLPVSPLPMLRNGFVTFGVFNRIDKISDEAIALWARIMAAIPDARLIVKHLALDDATVRETLVRRFTASGIGQERVSYAGRTTREAHLRAFDAVDLSLDPFPQNGGISTWESLYMGVPVIARLGTTSASRAAASILTAVGLPDFVAADGDAYVEIARRVAAAPAELAALRENLPARIAGSEAGDPARYAAAVEACYRRFWRAYCATAVSGAAAG